MNQMDLSYSEAVAALALALEGLGFPPGVTKILAAHAIDEDRLETALDWQPAQAPELIKSCANARLGRGKRRILLPHGLWDRLKTLAAHTHVPESEASKHSGAGAGLNDND